MTKEQQIKEIEEEIWTIFRKDYIPRFLVVKASALIYKWEVLTGWKVDNSPILDKPLPIIDDKPEYQK